LQVYETLWIKKLKSINELDPCGGLLRKHCDKQWREANKEELKAYKKQYYEENKEAIASKKKQTYFENRNNMLQKNKEYRLNNNEKIKEYRKQYYEKNRATILEKKKQHTSEKMKCECGKEVSKGNLSRHQKSKKHLKNLELQ
jgi:hypothetical protein